MKKRVLLILLVGIFMISVVSACDGGDSQIIMKLSSPTNAHGALWNETYSHDICYDEIFGGPYGGVDPHKCTETNRVLNLYRETNAHASIYADGDYTVPVCYGNLVCDYDITSGNDCSNGGKVVARMYYNNNSHISNASDTNYNITICCTSAPIWQNMNGEEITHAQVGDTVQMVLAGSSVGDFEIFEEGGGIFGGYDKIRVEENNITGFPSDNGNLVGYWTIKQGDLDKTENDYEEFFFRVGEETSRHLAISEFSDDDPMVLEIVSPDCGDYFILNAENTVKITASDEDNLITGNLTIEGETETWNFSNGGLELVDYTWDTAGTIRITVFANNSAGYVGGLVSNVMVIDESIIGMTNYVAACIDEPANFGDISSSIVRFDASSTTGERYTGFEGGGGTQEEIFKEELLFSWTFSDETKRLNLSGVDELSYLFYKTFATSGSNWAELDVSVA